MILLTLSLFVSGLVGAAGPSWARVFGLLGICAAQRGVAWCWVLGLLSCVRFGSRGSTSLCPAVLHVRFGSLGWASRRRAQSGAMFGSVHRARADKAELGIVLGLAYLARHDHAARDVWFGSPRIVIRDLARPHVWFGLLCKAAHRGVFGSVHLAARRSA